MNIGETTSALLLLLSQFAARGAMLAAAASAAWAALAPLIYAVPARELARVLYIMLTGICVSYADRLACTLSRVVICMYIRTYDTYRTYI